MTREIVYDAVIIGAGTMGMAAGAHLAKQNVKTLLIDAYDPPHHHGSHHGDTRMIRHAYGEGRQYVTLVKRAQQLWEELEKESGYTIFEKTGVLGLGPSDSTFLLETIASAKTQDLPLQVLSSLEVKEKWPGISIPDNFIGCFEAESGFIYCERAIQAYREIALQNGAALLTNTPVQQIDLKHHEWVKITTADTSFMTKTIIVTAGAWAAKLLPDLNLPIQPLRKTVGWFDTPEGTYDSGNFPAFYVEDKDKMFYGFPNLHNAGLKIGRTDGGQAIDPNQHTQNFGKYDSDEGELRQFLSTYMPEANNRLNKGKTCLYTRSPDSHFIIDRHPEHPNAIIACGFSGHGFKFGSVMGEVLSQMAIKGQTDYDISIFSLKRFL